MTGARPGRLVVVLGTGTEVGKTWVAARALEALRSLGRAVAARKPAQSADRDDPHATDADVLARATGEDPQVVCPAHRRYEVAMAPPMAAEVLGRPSFTVAEVAAEITWPDGTDLGLVETAGGVLSPIAADGTSLDLAGALAPDEVVLVADAGLGTVNGVRLSLAAIAAHPATVDRPVTVVLNRYDPSDQLHGRNAALLAQEGPDTVTGIGALVERWR